VAYTVVGSPSAVGGMGAILSAGGVVSFRVWTPDASAVGVLLPSLSPPVWENAKLTSRRCRSPVALPPRGLPYLWGVGAPYLYEGAAA
jgi:hypothetical protein